MKRSNLNPRYLLVDPLALAVACIISLLFANATQQYLNTAKRNFSDNKSQIVACFQTSDDSSPEDRPGAWWIEKIIIQKEKKNSQLSVTFSLHQDYSTRLCGFVYGLSQPLVWLPSIPIAHRKLII
jgi:hypothetical protein